MTTGSHPHSRLACHHKLIFGRSATAVYIYIYYNIRNVEVPTPLFLMPSVTPTEAYDSDVCESYFATRMGGACCERQKMKIGLFDSLYIWNELL